MKYSKDDKRKFYTLQCRFYNGEEDAPDWMNQNEQTIWDYEKTWVSWHVDGHSIPQYIDDYPKLKTFKQDDGTPLELKAVLCNRYCKLGGDVDSFMKFYLKEYSSRKTNKERRTEERRVMLTEKCRYYKGEKNNPWDNPSCSPVHHIRRLFWHQEQGWVNRLSESYKNKDFYCHFVKDYGLESFCKTLNVPESLLDCIMLWHYNKSVNAGYVPTKEDMRYFCKCIYIDLAPIGKKSLRYLSYYGIDSGYNQRLSAIYKQHELYTNIEQEYCNNCKDNKGFESKLIKDAKELKKKWETDERPQFLKNIDICAEQLAICLYVEAMIGKWCPYDDIDAHNKNYLAGVGDIPLFPDDLATLCAKQRANKK